jgi:hypothetical protein
VDETTRAALIAKYVAGETSEAEEAALQAWHDDRGHQRESDWAGPCFCCCDLCDPEEDSDGVQDCGAGDSDGQSERSGGLS